MKFYKPASFLLVLVCVFYSCSHRSGETIRLAILPSPSKTVVQGPSDLRIEAVKSAYKRAYDWIISQKDIQEWDDPTLSMHLNPEGTIPKEGYTLLIDSNQIQLEGIDSAGIWYGLMTLSQLIEDAENLKLKLPQLKIEDAPALAFRAIHLDVKHHLETQAYYYQLIDRLARLKVNAIILEIEDKLRYEKQALVGSSDAFTSEEWRAISDYAIRRNIRISPLVQGLGHASFILKHEKYKHLRDDPSSDWAFDPLNEETYQVQFDLYEDALKAFPHAEFLHVGGDEVHTTGKGSGKSALELQLYWLNRVSDFATKKGLTPIFWDDMPLQNAGLYQSMYADNMTKEQVDSIWAQNSSKLDKYLGEFPKNCIYMRWNYKNPSSLGNQKAMNWFMNNGLQVMGATAGQTRWNLMPQDQSNAASIRDFALISIENKAKGLLLTLWDDDSPHFELYMRGITNFAEYTWAGDRRNLEEVKTLFRHRTFGPALSDTSFAFIDQLEPLVADWKNFLLQSTRTRNSLKSESNPIQTSLLDLPDPDAPGAWSDFHQEKISLAKENHQKATAILQTIQKSKQAAVTNAYTLEVYEQVAKAVQFSNQAILSLAKFDETSPENRRQGIQEISSLPDTWNRIERELELVYGKTRQLHKPDEYILDQDHHIHLANQALQFSDWQFHAEHLFLEKLDKWITAEEKEN